MTASRQLRRAGAWAILGGILLGLGHFSAVPFWRSIIDLFLSQFPSAAAVIRVLGLFILLIASLGGLAAIIGGILFLQDHRRSGRLLIGFGAGFSLLSVLIYVVFTVAGQRGELGGNTIVILIGLFLAIYARGLAKEG